MVRRSVTGDSVRGGCVVRWGALLLVLASLCMGGGARAACKLGQLAELPVTVARSRILLPAKINGTDLLFIVDSGAFFSMLSPASAASLHLNTSPVPGGMVFTGIGGDFKASVTWAKTFTLVKSAIPNIEFVVGGSDLEAPAVGLIGQNVLGMGDVDYDLAHGAVRLIKPEGCGHVDLAYWGDEKPYSVIPIQSRDAVRNHTIGTVLVNGVRVHATFDTGAPNTILSLRSAARAGLRPGDPKVTFAGETGGLGRNNTKAWTAPIASFQIGDEKISNTKMIIADLGPDTEMLVGLDFFLSHRIYVANSQARMYLTYMGGAVFNLDAPPPETPSSSASATTADAKPPPPGPDEPTDAEGFSRRGGVLAARHQYARAVADFDRACALAPAEPQYFQQRALARLALHQNAPALADLDTVLKLKPDDPEARTERAALRLQAHDEDGARADLDAAAAAASKEANLRLQIGELYLGLDRYEAAVAQFDLWIAVHYDDRALPTALNGRCWARALAGRDLDKALSDCNTAVRLAQRSADVLDSRGLVHLRRGEFSRAIADYDAALAEKPKMAWSLYGRGLAELKTGDKAKGDADLAAAAAEAPHLAERAAKLGLTP